MLNSTSSANSYNEADARPIDSLETLLDRPLFVAGWDWEKTLYVLLIVTALITRLYGLGDRVQSHDESIHTRYSWNLYTGRGFAHDPLMHGPYLFHATALSYFLFGDNDFSARVPVALMGVALVAFPYLLRRWLGRSGALATTFLLLISPAIAYYSRYIRHDIPVALWAMIVWSSIFAYLHDGRSRWLYTMAAGVSLMFATKEVAFIYSAIFGVFLVVLFLNQVLSRRWPVASLNVAFLVLLGVAAAGLGLVALGVVRQQEGAGLASWAIAGGAVAGVAAVAATVVLLYALGAELRSYRSFDLIVVLATLCLPFLSPALVSLMGLDPIDYQPPTIYTTAIVTAGVVAVSAMIGLFWSLRRWSIAAAIHYAIFLVLFTTFFTNGFGIASGLVGSLGYWLKQHEVQRGNQPQYYYVVMVSFYEFLPWLLATLAPVFIGVRALMRRRNHGDRMSVDQGDTRERGATGDRAQGRPVRATREMHPGSDPAVSERTFVPFLLWWTALAWLAYSIAGERMPWLIVHITLPMIVLSGWLVGRLVDAVDWGQIVRQRAWILALVFPPLLMAIAALGRAVAARPFSGYELTQLNATGKLLGAVAGIVLFGGTVMVLAERCSWRLALPVLGSVLLLIPVALTVRTAWRFCYVTYDYATEFLVYAHAAPAVNRVIDQITEISQRTLDSPTAIEVAYGADGSTLWYWQLRNFPNARYYGEQPSREQMDVPVVIAGRDQWNVVAPYMDDNYVMNTYTYIWWPMEDYRNLTWGKAAKILTDADVRAAMWDIWYNRDYARYDALTQTRHTVDQWPLRSDFQFYVRRDVAARVWELSSDGLNELSPSSEASVPDPYELGWQDMAARLVIGSEGAAEGQLQAPRGVTVDAEGNIYVADSGNHRIAKFASDGAFLAAWGTYSMVEDEVSGVVGFNEPWGIALDAEGNLYVADTWNHRIQKLDAEGRFVTSWGRFGQQSVVDAHGEYEFFGPRGIAIGDDGSIYVTDTGNKRVLVFGPQGEFQREWGGGGVLDGYLDEPVGIAIGPDGLVYVADTWNARVQVFDAQGDFVRQWPLEGLEELTIEDKPHIAVDSRGYVYVTDPSEYRVLVFDSFGEFVMAFGQYGFDDRSFAYPTGVAIGQADEIYVTDARSGRVLIYDPLFVER
ncbi:MAG: TIGR03663 family protein [Chloroflexi bacterium]|nr:TIGR03663 family protein [Chloroflexota bacterium]